MKHPRFTKLATALQRKRTVLFVVMCAAVMAAPVIYLRLQAAGRQRAACNGTPVQAAASDVLGASTTADPTDMLTGHWQMPGSTLDTSGVSPKLVVRNMQSAIVQQDGSAGQDNAPVNLYGVCIQQSGSFSVTANLTDIKGNAAISLYGIPPVVEDEFRAELATLDVRLEGTAATVRVYTRPGTRPSTTKTTTITASDKHTVVIAYKRGMTSVAIDRAKPVSVRSSGLFPSSGVWFGAAATGQGGSFAVSGLRVGSVNGSTVSLRNMNDLQVPKATASLAALSQQKRSDFAIGAAVALGPFVYEDQYRAAAGNFNSYTTENALKFQFVHPLPGTDASSYDFSEADALVDIASRSGAKVHGHTLVFGEANPAWVQQLARTNPSQLESVMINHIQTVVGHYKGKVASWDVINEPLADYDTAPGTMGLRKHLWYNAMGPDYIAKALRAAHETDPAAELWINEFGLEMDDDRFADMLAVVTKLKQQGVPLTGVGFQSHLDEEDLDTDGRLNSATLKRHMQALANIGLKARVSELDVTDQSQFAAYGDVVATCLAQANCTGVTTWGITDAYSSGGGVEGGSYETGVGLLWDDSLRPTGGLTALQNVLR